MKPINILRVTPGKGGNPGKWRAPSFISGQEKTIHPAFGRQNGGGALPGFLGMPSGWGADEPNGEAPPGVPEGPPPPSPGLPSPGLPPASAVFGVGGVPPYPGSRPAGSPPTPSGSGMPLTRLFSLHGQALEQDLWAQLSNFKMSFTCKNATLLMNRSLVGRGSGDVKGRG